MPSVVEIENRNQIAVLRFNRPSVLNALGVELAQGIADSLIALDGDQAVDGIVLTGAGDRAFCAGVDLIEARGSGARDRGLVRHGMQHLQADFTD